MRTRFVTRQLAAAVVGGICLSGCSSLSAVPLESPAPADIVDFTQTFETYTNHRIGTAEDYVYAGYAYTDHNCQKFFNALEMARKNSLFAKDTLTSAGGLATEILTLLAESQTAIGIVSGAVGFVANGIERHNNLYNFAEYSPALWQHVSTAQSNFKSTDVPPTLELIAANPIDTAATFYQAHQIVQAYARLCSLPQIEYFVHTALNNSKTTAADVDEDTKKTGGAKKNKKSGAEGASLINRSAPVARARAFRLPVYEAR